jgi:hypothetical protein
MPSPAGCDVSWFEAEGTELVKWRIADSIRTSRASHLCHWLMSEAFWVTWRRGLEEGSYLTPMGNAHRPLCRATMFDAHLGAERSS